MAIPHAYPGAPINLRPSDETRSEAETTALVKENAFQAIRLVVPKGHEIPRHQVPGPITVYCLDGRVAFTADDKTHDLKAGHWLYLLGDVPHSIVGVEDSALLVTILFK